jgi:hypothetical protein
MSIPKPYNCESMSDSGVWPGIVTVNASNPNDTIRGQVLSYFYERNDKATSRFGKRGSAVKISDVKAELKALHGLTQQQVMSNLTYLTDRGWVKTVDETKTVTTTRGTTIPSKVTYYEISAEGIDRVEGGSDFELSKKYAGININAVPGPRAQPDRLVPLDLEVLGGRARVRGRIHGCCTRAAGCLCPASAGSQPAGADASGCRVETTH